MAEIYRQCMLKRPSQNGYLIDVFWIDNKLAKEGKRVQDETGHVWTIVELYNTRTVKDVNAVIDLWRRFKEVLDG